MSAGPGLARGAARDESLDAIVAAYATPCFVVKGGRVLRHEDEAAKARYGFNDFKLKGGVLEGRDEAEAIARSIEKSVTSGRRMI